MWLNEVKDLIRKICPNGNVFYSDMLTENAESNNRKPANNYLKQYVQDKTERDNIIKEIQRKIPNVKRAEYKFLLGITRMWYEGQLKDDNIRETTNQTLDYLIRHDLVNNLDRNLNGMTAEQFINQYAQAVQAEIDKNKEELNSKEYNGSERYDIVRIDSFEQATEYDKYTNWCITNDKEEYDSHTNEGQNVFYFCLRKGYENIPREVGPNCPLDEYGLSMIAVCVRPNGSCATCTCRWNHANGGNYNIMNPEEISEVIGMNYYSIFKPLDEETIKKRKMQKINEVLQNGEFIKTSVSGMNIITDGQHCVVVNDKKKLIKNESYYNIKECPYGLIVGLNDYQNILTPNGSYLFNQWFKGIFYDSTLGLFNVTNNHNLSNYIDKDGTPLFKQWFWDIYYDKNLDLFKVDKNQWLCGYIDKDGNLLSNQWFMAINYDKYLGLFCGVNEQGRRLHIDKEGNEITV